MKSSNKPSIFLMPEDLIEQIEKASLLLGISKSAVVRNSLRRDLDFVLRHEALTVANSLNQRQEQFDIWREGQA